MVFRADGKGGKSSIKESEKMNIVKHWRNKNFNKLISKYQELNPEFRAEHEEIDDFVEWTEKEYKVEQRAKEKASIDKEKAKLEKSVDITKFSGEKSQVVGVDPDKYATGVEHPEAISKINSKV